MMLLKATEVWKATCPFTKSWILNLDPRMGFKEPKNSLTLNVNGYMFTHLFRKKVYNFHWVIPKVSLTQRLRSTSPNISDCSACFLKDFGFSLSH